MFCVVHNIVFWCVYGVFLTMIIFFEIFICFVMNHGSHWKVVTIWLFTSRSSPVWFLRPSCCGLSRVGSCYFLRRSGTSLLECGSGSDLPGTSSCRLPWAPCRLRNWTKILRFIRRSAMLPRWWVKFGNKYLISGGRDSLGLLLCRGLLRFSIDAWNNSTALGGARPRWVPYKTL